MSSSRSVPSRLAALLPALLISSALLPTPARADVSDPFLLENVSREIDSTTFFDAVELAGFDVLLQPREPGLRRTNPERTATVRVDSPVTLQVLGVTADRQRAFIATEPEEDRRVLYVTDGTDAGTRPLGPAGQRLLLGDNLDHSATTGLFYFNVEVARGTGTSIEVWATDGTPAGTRRVLGGLVFQASFGAETGGLTLFTAAGLLYRTDGTPAGTRPVREDLRVLSLGRDVFYPLGSGVVFAAQDEDRDRKLWITDGTAAGTTRLQAPASEPELFLAWPAATVSGDLFYAVVEPLDLRSRELVVSDGTLAGTRVLTESIDLTAIGSFLTPLGERSVYFNARTDANGLEPWVSDGTPEGTHLLADLCPGECGSGSYFELPFSGGLYLLVSLEGGEADIYVTDGTEGGTRPLGVCSGPCRNTLSPIGVDGDRLYFYTEDADGGLEIFFTDAGGPPVRLTDFVLRRPFPSRSSARLASGGLYVSVEVPGVGIRVFRSEGVPGDAREVLALDVPFEDLGSDPSGFHRFDGDLFFVAEDGVDGEVLYRKSDGEPARRLALVDPDPVGAEPPDDLYTVGSKLLVHDRTSSSVGGPLYASDGTQGDLVELAELILGGWPLGDRFFFTRRGISQTNLWVTDGTPAGTVLVDQDLDFGAPATFEGRLYYGRDGGLWRTDGTAGGTTRVIDLDAFDAERVNGLEVADGRLYMAAEGVGTAVAVSDGTPAGTRLLTTERFLSNVLLFGLAGDHLVLQEGGFGDTRSLWSVAPDGRATLLLEPFLASGVVPVGDELWIESFTRVIRTDGTPGGTLQVGLPKDDSDARIDLFGIPGGLLYVERGGTSQMPEETLWFTEGTPAGTRRLRDFVEVGAEMVVIGDRVYFAADDGEVGLEPWALDILSAGPPPPPPPPPTDVPAAPRNLRTTGTEFSNLPEILLRWDDASDNEARFEIQAKRWGSDTFRTVAEVVNDSTGFTFDLDSGVDTFGPQVFRVRAVNGQGASEWSEEVVGVGYLGNDCFRDETLCLQGDRFRVETYWDSERNGTSGRGTATPFDVSDDSGIFWFFDPANVELVVKVLDGRVVNGHFWNFYGALSDVGYLVVVEDTARRENVVYENPEGNLCGQADVTGFPELDALRAGLGVKRLPPSPASSSTPGAGDHGAAGACVPDADTLCLTPDRFRVTVTWRDQRSGDTGVGHAIPGTSDSGYFWFFDAENVELVVKVLDARTVNGFHWVFYGALTDVEYTLTVTDTETGETKEYFNPPGNICGDADVKAF